MGIHEGDLLKYNTRTDELSKFRSLVRKNILRDVMCFGDEIWVGSLHGIFIINEKENNVIHLKEDLMRSFSLSDNVFILFIKIMKEEFGLEQCLRCQLSAQSYLDFC